MHLFIFFCRNMNLQDLRLAEFGCPAASMKERSWLITGSSEGWGGEKGGRRGLRVKGDRKDLGGLRSHQGRQVRTTLVFRVTTCK